MGTKRFSVAVAGATGAVGEVMLRILEERKFPIRKIAQRHGARRTGAKARHHRQQQKQAGRTPCARMTKTRYWHRSET